MILSSEQECRTLKEILWEAEAGTGIWQEQIGLAAAIDYLEDGMDAIVFQHEQDLIVSISKLQKLTIYGSQDLAQLLM